MISLVGASGRPVFLRTRYPAHIVLTAKPAARAGVGSQLHLRFLVEKFSFVNGHGAILPMSTIFFYVSGHGYGHASRQVEIIRALRAKRGDIRLFVRTSAPSWLFERGLGDLVELSHVEVDTGVVQIDSLKVDVAASTAQASAFHEQLEARSESEARLLTACRADLVVADIPPLAFSAAARAGLPAAAAANFTWDWIYGAYQSEVARTPNLVPRIQRAYATAAVAWRLPMHGGFESFSRIVDVPHVARRSSRDPRDVRKILNLPTTQPLVLISFGRYGLSEIDWSTVATITDYGIVLTHNGNQYTAVDGVRLGAGSPFRLVDEGTLRRSGLSYEDLVRAMDAVITKPGYGIIAECAANDTAVLYTSRGRFIEYDILVEAMPRYVRCGYIPQDALFRGDWKPPLDALLAAPRPAAADFSGAAVIADGILELL